MGDIERWRQHDSVWFISATLRDKRYRGIITQVDKERRLAYVWADQLGLQVVVRYQDMAKREAGGDG